MGETPWAVERRWQRYALDVRATLLHGSEQWSVRTLDISEGGLGLICPVELPDHARYSVEFVFPGVPGTFRASLQRCSRTGFRYGFMFVRVEESESALLKKFIRRCAYPAPATYAGRA